MRKLSNTFMKDLQNADGILYPLMERVLWDDTLLLSIRDGYLNVYYRGGNLVRIVEKADASYQAQFDTNYFSAENQMLSLPDAIRTPVDIQRWIDAFGVLKSIMDHFFHLHPKLEREFQQVVTRINNSSSLSNSTEYFITDIEFADSSINARIDMIGIRWLTSHRKNGSQCRAVFMEMKFGDHALDGNAGLLKHLQDFHQILSDSSNYQQLCETIETQFLQLDQLGLVQFNHSTNGTMPHLDPTEKPEVIFLVANHNPRSTKLSSILANSSLDDYANSPYFDLCFAAPGLAGYALHADGMVTLEEFRKLLKK